MDVLYLAIIFLIIVAIIWLKKPLYLAMTAGIVAAVLLFRVDPLEALKVLGRQTVAWETIDLLISFYVIMFLQLMLERKGRLVNAQNAFDALLRNRRVNTMVSPAIVGLLPSAAVMSICADMTDKTCGEYLDARTKTFVSCYYRHIPELFLPTFPVILLAMTLSGQNIGVFILAMLPLMVLAFAVVYFVYLRKIPKEMPPLEGAGVNAGEQIVKLLKNLWTLLLVLIIIVAGNLSACVAGPIVILINFFVDRFKLRDLPQLLVKSAEPVMLGNMYLIMLFKSILAHTGVLTRLPDYFARLPIPLPLAFFLLFFFGTVISGSQTMIALCMPLLIASFPGAEMPMLVMIMGCVWAAMELSPTHVCAFVAADFYKTTLGDIIVKGLVPVLIFAALSYGYGQLLTLIL